jgi:hypothetical protein
VQFEAPGPYHKPLRGTAPLVVSAPPPASCIAMAIQPDLDGQTFLDSLHLGKK